jgi:hypothetical protein
MLNTKEIITAILVTLASGFSAQAAAGGTEPGWYVGADLGHVELQLEQAPNISNKDLSDSVFAIHGG